MGVRTFSRSRDGERNLSEHFKVWEFACKDGTDEVRISDELVTLLQQIRNYYGKPVTINSGYRTVAYNRGVGGAPRSQHLRGTAADIVVLGVPPAQVYRDLDSGRITGRPHTGGLGRYRTFTHVDVRTRRSRW